MNFEQLEKLKHSAEEITSDIARDDGSLYVLAEEVFNLGVQYGWLLSQQRLRFMLMEPVPKEVLNAVNTQI